MENTVTVHVRLMDEGCARPTQAIPMENGTFKLLPIPNYDKVEELWEFLPGSVVHAEKKTGTIGEYMLAVEKVN